MARQRLCYAIQAAEKVVYFVIPSEARNLSSISMQEKRDSSARSAPRNDKNLSFPQAVLPELSGSRAKPCPIAPSQPDLPARSTKGNTPPFFTALRMGHTLDCKRL